MRRVFTILAIACATVPVLAEESDISGFASFSWGSSTEFVRTEQAKDGKVPFDDVTTHDAWLWYVEMLNDCATEYGYRFQSDRFVSGLMLIEASGDCWAKTYEFLRTVYEVDDIASVGTDGAVFAAPDTRIVLRRDRIGSIVQISFYWEPDQV